MKIEVLYPEVCSLYGDLGNIKYLKESDDSIEIINTSLKETPKFTAEKIDLIYMGTATEEGIRLSVKALTPYKEKLKSLIDDGQLFLLTGNALDIFSEGVSADLCDDLPGLGIIPAKEKYKMLDRHNSFYVGSFNTGDEDIKVVGFRSLFGLSYLTKGNKTEGFFKTIRGIGRNEADLTEGYRINNLYATTLIGPLLILNPLLTRWLLKKMGSNNEPAFMEASMDSYNQRLKELENEHFNPIY